MKIAAKVRFAFLGSSAVVLGLGLLDFLQSREIERALLGLRQYSAAEHRAVIGIRESLGVLGYALADPSAVTGDAVRTRQIGNEALETIASGVDRLQDLDERPLESVALDGSSARRGAQQAMEEFRRHWVEFNARLEVGQTAEAERWRLETLLPTLSGRLNTALDRYITHLRAKHTAELDQLTAESRRGLLVKLASGGLLLAVAALITYLMHRGVLKPLRQLEVEVGRVARGEGPFRASTHRTDELGSVARAINGLLGTLQTNTDTKTEIEAALSTRTQELRERELELQRESERLSLALDALRTSIWDFDIPSGRVKLDAGWALMLGGPAQATEESVRRLGMRVHPQEREACFRATRDCVNGIAEHYSVEHRVQNVRGEWIWIQSKGIVTAWDQNGHATRMIGTNTDVTVRKNAELSIGRQVEFLNALNQTTLALLQRQAKSEVLEALAGRAAALLSSAQVEVALIEGDELVTHAYGGANRITLGRRATRSEAVLSWRAVDTCQPVFVEDYETLAGVSRVYQQAHFHAVAIFPIMLGSRCLGVLGFLRSESGNPYTLEEQQKGLALAQLAALAIHNAQIYEDAVKVAEARTHALRESEALFKGVFDESPIPIIVLSYPEGRILEANKATNATFGYTREESLGFTTAELNIWADPEDRTRFMSRLNTEGAVSGVDTCMRVKDGRIINVIYNATRISIAGRPCLLSSLIDITAQKQAEAALRTSEAHLRQSQKMEALGTLAGGIAHDFNNILTGVLGHAELALGDLDQDHPAHAWMEGILKSGVRAKNLVQQILTFSRKTESMRVATRVQLVTMETISLLRSTLPAMVRIDAEIDPQCPPALVDGTQIHQVVLNLCTNAWQALPENGGVITVTLRPEYLSLEDVRHLPPLAPGPHLLLSVRDNGRGMDARTVERIFEPFFTTKGAGKGTGLGLAVVHSIVTAHGGAISVQSAPGHGSRFDIRLPAIDAVDAAGGTTPAIPLAVGRGEAILVVDDEPTSGMVVAKLLERLGYKPTYCSDPREALPQLATGNFAMLLTDLAMPGIPGDELARQVLERYPHLPVMLLSGFLEPTKLEAIRRHGVREILGKPPTYAELAVTVDRCLHTVAVG